MISHQLLWGVILLVVKLFALSLLLFFGHALWLYLSRRWEAPRIQRGRAILASLGSLPRLREEDMQVLRSFPRRIQTRLVVELAGSIRGAERDRLHDIARDLGIVRVGERLCGSALWWRRIRGIRLLTTVGGGEEIVPRLLDDPHPLVRTEAAVWASAHPAPPVIDRLIDHLRDPSGLCRFTVRDSLLRIGPPAIGPLEEYLGSPNGREVQSALEIAAAFADPRFLTPALGLLDHPSEGVRASAATVIGAIGGTEAVETLTRLLGDEHQKVRAAASAALGRLGHWPAAPLVARLLRDPAWEVRRTAANTLVEMGSPGLLFLRRALNDPDDFAADMARQVLDLIDVMAS